MSISVRKQRDLPISAASGLVIEGDALYVIADDGLHLHAYSLTDAHYEQRIRLREGQLPADKKARKKQKPDFESLLRLPAQAGLPHGALFAIGSGSKPNRQQGVLVPFGADGMPDEGVRELDLAALYATLPFADTNIEGALLLGEQLVLLQRGNNRHESSALVILPVASVGARFIAPEASTIPVTLPRIGDVPLGFTDGLCLPNGNILFSAVAEDTDDSYNDGACLAAAIGEITLHGELLRCEWLAEPHKIEGIALDASGTRLYAVTDADDPTVSAALLEIVLEGWWQ